jgi:putative ABC transport system permease protein
MKDVESLVDIRNHFRRSGVQTSSSLDEIATIRELRKYALTVGSTVGFITLIAAACSIFNTLIASVERRVREIGILRALGASSANVLTIFLLEGAINALFGGALAAACLVLGASVANTWMLGRLSQNEEFSKIVQLKPELFAVPHWLPLLVLVLGVCVSFLASLLPAIRACFVEPTAALRHE